MSHQWPRPDDAPDVPGFIPGRWIGGAEMVQELMRSKAPADVELVLVDSRGPIDEALDCDRIIVAGVELIAPLRQKRLVDAGAKVWLMSPPCPAYHYLLNNSEVAWASDGLRTYGGYTGGIVCPGWWDTSVVPEAVERDIDVLWAHRDHPLKGEAAVRQWCEDNGRQLTVVKNRPRSEVLEAMSRARTFVHLPYVFDPCPTAVIEAEIAGCEIVVNNLVGRTPVRGREANIDYIEGCADLFWRWLCS